MANDLFSPGAGRKPPLPTDHRGPARTKLHDTRAFPAAPVTDRPVGDVSPAARPHSRWHEHHQQPRTARRTAIRHGAEPPDPAHTPGCPPTRPDPAVSVRHLRKSYGVTVAVDDVSFQVAPGEIFGILGPTAPVNHHCGNGHRPAAPGRRGGQRPGTEPLGRPRPIHRGRRRPTTKLAPAREDPRRRGSGAVPVLLPRSSWTGANSWSDSAFPASSAPGMPRCPAASSNAWPSRWR